MTNTRITDPEVLESRYPVRLLEFSLRARLGRRRSAPGRRRRRASLSRSSPRSSRPFSASDARPAPYGLAGGEPGAPGRNRVERGDGGVEELPGKCSRDLRAGDVLCVETPGGGGYGAETAEDSQA